MKIVSGNSGPLYPDRSSGVRNGDQPATSESRQGDASAAAQTDRVEISSAGRARALEELRAASAGVAPVPADAHDRMLQVAQRIQDGTYNSDGVQVAVARSLLQRGDV